MDVDTLFPGELLGIYEAVRDAVAAEGEAIEEVKKTQVSFGAARKFAWLLPLTKATCLLNLDLGEEHASPLWRDVIRYREDKFTHQAVLADPADARRVAAAGYVGLAFAWGQRRGPR